MRAIEIAGFGGPDVLRLADRPTPRPGAGEALIRIAGAGVNRPEVLQRMGLYPPPPGATDIPGLECAGVVESVGPGVSDLAPGDKVAALLAGGGYAEFATVDAGSCLKVPESLPLHKAGAYPEATFTVFANVYDDADLKPGETLLLHGGTSGIGAAAIAYAKATGSRVVATASSEEKCARIRAMGADLALDYRSDTWEQDIAAFGGADVVLDMAGGDFVRRNLAVLNPGGRHVSIAMLRGPVGEFDIFMLMRKRLRISGSTMKIRSAAEKRRLRDAIAERLWPHVASGKVRLPIEGEFPLGAAADAHRLMESGGHVGKILLRP